MSLFQTWTTGLLVQTPLWEKTIVNIFSSHGELGVHLYRIGKRIGPDCETYNQPDLLLHRLATCEKYDHQRRSLNEVEPDAPQAVNIYEPGNRTNFKG